MCWTLYTRIRLSKFGYQRYDDRNTLFQSRPIRCIWNVALMKCDFLVKESPVLPWPAPSPLWVACGADSARPAWRATALSPAAGVRGWLGREPGGDTGGGR